MAATILKCPGKNFFPDRDFRSRRHVIGQRVIDRFMEHLFLVRQFQCKRFQKRFLFRLPGEWIGGQHGANFTR